MALDKLTKITSQSGITTSLDYSMSDLTVDTITIRSGGGIGGGRINTGLVTVTTLTPGTVVHVGTGQTLTESDNLTWDNTNVRLKNLGITSTKDLNITGVTTTTGNIHLNSTDKKIYLTSDYDQYITANAASNYIVFAAANKERLRITSAGALRLSDTNDPWDQNTDIWVADDALNFNAYGTNGAFIFKSGSSSTERLRIASGGNVGIGTNNPASLLHLENAAPVFTVKATNASSGLRINVKGQSSGQLFRVQDDNTTKFVLEESGRVGIGSAIPDHALDVNDTGLARIRIRNDATASGSYASLNLHTAKGNWSLYSEGTSSANNYLKIWNNVDGSVFYIKEGGNIGINEDSPSEKLDVNGTIQCLNELRSRTGNDLLLNAGSVNRDVKIQVNDVNMLYVKGDTGNIGIGTDNPIKQLMLRATIPFIRLQDGTASSKRLDLWVENSDGFIGANQSAQKLHFQTTGTTRLTINKDGDVNIGTNFATLSGIGTIRVHSGSTAGALNLDGGATNHGGEINLLGGSNGGRIIFRTGQGSGQQSERMRLSENGDLAITTRGSVEGVSKLNVEAESRTTAFSASDGDTWHDVLIENPGAATNNAVGLCFQVTGDSYHTNAGTGIACVKNGTNSDYGADMVFITRPQSAVAAERLRIHDDGYIVAQGSICAGGDNAAAHLIKSGGLNRAFMHYFNCVKTVATGTGATRDIVTVSGLGTFHQSIIIVEYGTRLQAVSDQTTGCVHRVYGINRFNSGTLTVTETNGVFGSTNSLDDALINIEVVSNTEFRVRLTFASNLGTSSFASGMVRGFACNDQFNTISFDHGWGGG